MARLATPVLGNFNQIEIGDNSVLKSTIRTALWGETFALALRLLVDVAQEQTSLNLVIPQAAFDDDAGVATFTATLGYYTDVAGMEKYNASLYITPSEYSWITATTGETAGHYDVFDSLVEQTRYMMRINDTIRAKGGLINSASGLITLDKNETNSVISISASLPFDPITSASGAQVKQLLNYPILLDLERGNALVI